MDALRLVGARLAEAWPELRLRWLEDEQVRALSEGELRVHWGINSRTGKPEREGLFCAKTFGPTESFCCLCTKYRGAEHEGVRCEKCGVLVGPTELRRERFGHIELGLPLPHPWSGRTIEALLFLPAGLREPEPGRESDADLTGINSYYQKLIRQNNQTKQCMKYRPPAALEENERRLLGEHLGRLFGALEGRPGRKMSLGAKLLRALHDLPRAEPAPPPELRALLLACGIEAQM